MNIRGLTLLILSVYVSGGRGAFALAQDSVSPPSAEQMTSSHAQKKFREMGVLERNAILREIGARDLTSIFQAMLDAKRVEGDARKQGALQTVLAGALRTRSPNPEFSELLWTFVNNSSEPLFERQLVVGALSLAASPASVDLLIRLATSSPNPAMKSLASASIATVGNLSGAGVKLMPMLEQVWRDSGDRQLLGSVAMAMAEIGAPSGIELLLQAALDTDDRGDPRRDPAKHCLSTKVYRAQAVPPLAARLRGQTSKSKVGTMIAPVLVRIGDKVAAKVIVEWLQSLDENAEVFIREKLFQETRTEAMVVAWESAAVASVTFRNDRNQDAIRAGLEHRNAGRRRE